MIFTKLLSSVRYLPVVADASEINENALPSIGFDTAPWMLSGDGVSHDHNGPGGVARVCVNGNNLTYVSSKMDK